MTKRKRMTASQSAPLYAALMVEEYEHRFCYPEDKTFAEVDVRTFSYLHFLRSQRDTHPAYAMAIRQIEGKP